MLKASAEGSAVQLGPEADAALAALDPRSLGLVRWTDAERRVIASPSHPAMPRLSVAPARGRLRSVASAVPIPPPGFDELTPEEKVRYVGALWDRIVADQDRLPISDAQRTLIRQRLAAHEANPGAARPWSEVRREVERAISERRSR